VKYKVNITYTVIEDTADWDDDYPELTADELVDYIKHDIGTNRWLSKGFPDAEPTVNVKVVVS